MHEWEGSSIGNPQYHVFNSTMNAGDVNYEMYEVVGQYEVLGHGYE